MTWTVYRNCGGGLIDWCGTVEAASDDEALMVARLMHFCSGEESIEVEQEP